MAAISDILKEFSRKEIPVKNCPNNKGVVSMKEKINF
jgi:hypothetical protein